MNQEKTNFLIDGNIGYHNLKNQVPDENLLLNILGSNTSNYDVKNSVQFNLHKNRILD